MALPHPPAQGLHGLSSLQELSLVNCGITSLDGCGAGALTPALCARRLATRSAPAAPFRGALSRPPRRVVHRRSFPPLPALARLLLSDNGVAGGLAALAASTPSLTSLDLSGNRRVRGAQRRTGCPLLARAGRFCTRGDSI